MGDLEEWPGLGVLAASELCHEDFNVCRKVAEDDYRCFDCTAPETDGWGCPCNELVECSSYGPNLTCWGLPGPDPREYPAPEAVAFGACFPLGEPLPGGYCADACAAQGRVCGSMDVLARDHGVVDICVTPECTANVQLCEEQVQTPTCDRDSGTCVAACLSDLDCPQDTFCTTWGECWSGSP